MLRRALIALSLANIFFLPAWREVLDPGPLFHCYHTKLCPVGAELLAVALNTTLLAAALFAGYELARRSGRPLLLRAAQALFLVFFLLCLNAVRVQYRGLLLTGLTGTLGRAGALALGLAALGLGAYALWRVGFPRLVRAAAAAALILSPFVFVAYGQALWQLVWYRSVVAERGELARPQPAREGAARPRVFWLIFDELDYRLAFEQRPAGLALPEFDRLLAESLSAREAYPPGAFTIQVLPALLTGKLVAEAVETRPDDLNLRFHEESEWVGWRGRPNIFGRAREAGFNAGVAGWHHPYCRMFKQDLVRCSWGEDTFTELGVVQRASVAGNMLRGARMSFFSVPALHRLVTPREEVFRHESALLEEKSRKLSELVDNGRALAADPQLQLVLVHLPIPHPPNFYDRASGRFAFDAPRSYLDSLALTDRTLGELRREMEAAGLWDSTAVLVSSDHWWRAREVWAPVAGIPDNAPYWNASDTALVPAETDYRVPFILKLPGQRQATNYDPAFNTILSHDLVLGVLRGELKTPGEVAAWLDRHRSVGQSPYYHFANPTAPNNIVRD
ncbi:MAG TPA: sulfatase-like hydrolase/transferase [Pyrinomonadaceae bacterium]|nr:sulfatase-like hydrolase/transferase [Pyrinomonadaceae bacterium]